MIDGGGREIGQSEIAIHVSARRTAEGDVSCLFKGALGQHRVFFPGEFRWDWRAPDDMRISAVSAREAKHSAPSFVALYWHEGGYYYVVERHAEDTTSGHRFDGDLDDFADEYPNVLWTAFEEEIDDD